MFRKITLPNKLRIITAPMKGTNTVTILVMCGTGSDHETEQERGISHFLEHMFFKGTKERRTPQVIKHELDTMGSISNAFTGHEYTGYFIKSGHVYFDRALDLLADIYTNALLDPKEINRERQVIVEEMHKYLDTPERYIWDIWEELLYGDQPAGRDIMGTETHVRNFTPDQFRKYFKKQYTADNTIVIVAGNFDEAHAVRKITQLFDTVRSSVPKLKGRFAETQKNPALKLHYKETDQTHIVLGFRGYDAHHPRRYAAEMLGTILGGNWSSRMWDVVRDRLGLAYAVGSAHESYSNRGFLVTYAGVAHSNVEKAIRAITAEYRKIAQNGVSAKELSRAKDYIKGTSLIGLESSSAVANFVGIEEVVTGKPVTIQEVFAKIEKIAPADIERAARELIRPDRANLAIIGPFKDGARFAKLLKL